MRGQLVVGAGVRCYINNRSFGRVADFSYSLGTPRKKLHGIDWLPPIELIQQSVDVDGEMTIYRLHKDGGAEAAGMVGTWPDLSREKYFSLVLIDRSTDTVIFQANQCSTTGQHWRIGRGYVLGNIRFSGIQYNNETAPSANS